MNRIYKLIFILILSPCAWGHDGFVPSFEFCKVFLESGIPEKFQLPQTDSPVIVLKAKSLDPQFVSAPPFFILAQEVIETPHQVSGVSLLKNRTQFSLDRRGFEIEVVKEVEPYDLLVEYHLAEAPRQPLARIVHKSLSQPIYGTITSIGRRFLLIQPFDHSHPATVYGTDIDWSRSTFEYNHAYEAWILSQAQSMPYVGYMRGIHGQYRLQAAKILGWHQDTFGAVYLDLSDMTRYRHGRTKMRLSDFSPSPLESVQFFKDEEKAKVAVLKAMAGTGYHRFVAMDWNRPNPFRTHFATVADVLEFKREPSRVRLTPLGARSPIEFAVQQIPWGGIFETHMDDQGSIERLNRFADNHPSLLRALPAFTNVRIEFRARGQSPITIFGEIENNADRSDPVIRLLGLNGRHYRFLPEALERTTMQLDIQIYQMREHFFADAFASFHRGQMLTVSIEARIGPLATQQLPGVDIVHSGYSGSVEFLEFNPNTLTVTVRDSQRDLAIPVRFIDHLRVLQDRPAQLGIHANWSHRRHGYK